VKPANVFFLRPEGGGSSISGSSRPGGAVCLIDYQWAGAALAVTDVVYLLATAASDDFILDLDPDEGLLRPYYSAFSAAYTAAPPPLQYSFEDLRRDFRLALLDYVRWAVCCRLGGDTPEQFAARRDSVDPNVGSYRRSDRMLRFLLQLAMSYLPAVEEDMMMMTATSGTAAT
jgi:hypothetical protein